MKWPASIARHVIKVYQRSYSASLWPGAGEPERKSSLHRRSASFGVLFIYAIDHQSSLCQTSRRIALMSRHDARAFGILLLASLLSLRADAQTGRLGTKDIGNPANVTIATKYETAEGTGVVVLHVFAEKTGALLKGHVQLQLTNLANNLGLIQSISGDQEGIFTTLNPETTRLRLAPSGTSVRFKTCRCSPGRTGSRSRLCCSGILRTSISTSPTK